MSEIDDLAALVKGRRERAKGTRTKKASEAFHRPGDDMQRVNIYIPAKVHLRLKQRALDEGTSVSAIITEEAERRLSEPVRKKEPPRRPSV